MKNKGFTLIELLAVIIILGILMLIAIPSVTNYIERSRKSTYVESAKELLRGASNLINSGELDDIYDTDTTYYIPVSAIKTENGEAQSPFGKYEPAYIAVTYDGEKFDYYFVGKDEANKGVPSPLNSDSLNDDAIKSNVGEIPTDVGIGFRKKVKVYDDALNVIETKDASSNVTEDSGEEFVFPVCIRAKSLHTEVCNSTFEGCLYNFNNGDTMTYGQIGSKGSLHVGDAFDCDVNNDKEYDPETERFYYVSDYYDATTNSFDDTKAALLHYASLNKNLEPTYEHTNYSNSSTTTYYGPKIAYGYIPKKANWTNPQLINTSTRLIVNELGGTTVGTDTINNPFNYQDKAAREEILSRTPSKCIFLWERIAKYTGAEDNQSFGYSYGIRLETAYSDNKSQTWSFWARDNNLIHCDSNFAYFNVRPVIDVLKTNMIY